MRHRTSGYVALVTLLAAALLIGLSPIGAQDGPALEPADDRHAVAPRERADLVTRAVHDDARPLRSGAAFVEQQVG